MSKVLVEVYVPAADKCSDVLIPYECTLFEVTELLKAIFGDDAESSFAPDESTVLCDRATGSVFDVDQSPRDVGLCHGSRLMLL